MLSNSKLRLRCYFSYISVHLELMVQLDVCSAPFCVWKVLRMFFFLFNLSELQTISNSLSTKCTENRCCSAVYNLKKENAKVQVLQGPTSVYSSVTVFQTVCHALQSFIRAFPLELNTSSQSALQFYGRTKQIRC